MEQIFTYDPQSAGSKGLVYIGDKILIYRRDNKTKLFPLYLDLPGGGPEGTETPFETFQREVMEEFGLRVTPEDVVRAHTYQSTLEPTKPAYFIVVQLPASTAKQIHFGDEGLEYMLLSPEDYLSRTDAWPAIQQRARDYIASLSK